MVFALFISLSLTSVKCSFEGKPFKTCQPDTFKYCHQEMFIAYLSIVPNTSFPECWFAFQIFLKIKQNLLKYLSIYTSMSKCKTSNTFWIKKTIYFLRSLRSWIKVYVNWFVKFELRPRSTDLANFIRFL